VFGYRVSNNFGNASDEAFVSLTIDIDLAPVALDDTGVLVPGESIELAVLENDIDDFDLDVASVVIETLPEHGTVSIDDATGVVSYQHNGSTNRSDSFEYSVADTAGQISNTALVTLEIPEGIVESNLVLRLESDAGVTLVSNQVTEWEDLSSSGNHLTASGNPSYISDGLTVPVVRFDGIDDLLIRQTSITNLPAGSDDRAVYMLVNYLGRGFGGFAYGDAANNETFGLAVDRVGRLMVQGFGAENDFISNIPGEGAGWLIQSAVLDDGQLSHFVNGALIAQNNHEFSTTVERIVLGAEISGNPAVDMNVATVLVYDAAHTSAEHAQVVQYIEDKYGLTSIGDPAPVAIDDFVTVNRSGFVDIAVLNNDSDINSEGQSGQFDLASIDIVTQPLNGSVSVNSVTGVVTYSHSGQGVTDQFSYRIADSSGRFSNPANVFVTSFVADGLIAHYDAGSLVNVDQDGNVVEVGDLSGTGNALRALGDVTVLPNELNGNPVFDLDGTGDALVREAPIDFPMGSSERSVYLVVSYESVGSGGFGYGRRALNQTFGLHVQQPDGVFRINGFGGPFDFVSDVQGTGAGWIIQSAIYDGLNLDHQINGESIGTFTTTFNTQPGDLVLGADLDLNPFVDMQVAAVLVYDRALDTEENNEVIEYLENQFEVAATFSPVANNDSAELLPFDSVVIGVIDNDIGNQLLPGSVEISTNPQSGFVNLDTTTGNVEYVNTDETASDEFTYTVLDALGRSSNEAKVTIQFDAPPPQTVDDVIVAGSDSAVVVDVLGNDNDDSEIDINTLQIVRQPEFGTATVLPDGTIEYLFLGAGQDSTDSFTYVVVDDAGGVSQEATVVVLLSELDHEPIALDDEFLVATGDSAVLNVLANDIDNSPLMPSSVVIIDEPLNGTATVDVTTGEIQYTHGATVFGDTFSYMVADQLGQFSQVAQVEIKNLPTAGMVALYEARDGVNVDVAGNVQEVQDQSGFGNDLTAVGELVVIEDQLNGMPVFDFDGVDDVLIRDDDIAGFPLGNSARTVIQLVRYDSVGSGGFGYGRRSLNGTFGLHVQAPTGSLRINGFGAQADFVSNVVGTGAGWIVQAVIYDGLNLVHYLNDEVIDANQHTFATQIGPIVMGADLDQVPFVDMQVASTLVYDRDLSDAEFDDVLLYMNQVFGIGVSALVDEPPVAVADAASVDHQGSVEIGVAANDEDDLGLDLSSVVITGVASLGTTEVDAVTGLVTYTHTDAGTEASNDSFEYTISDSGGQTATATVTVAIAAQVDEPPVAVDDEIAVSYKNSVDVPVLTNDSDDGNVDLTSVVVVDQPVYGTTNVDPITGQITYMHESGIVLFDSFTYTVQDDAGNTSNEAEVVVTVEAPTLPTAGLVLHLEADSGISSTVDQIVTAWEDQTDNINDLAVSSITMQGPTLVPGILNSHPVIDFDGIDDLLANSNSLSGLPTQNSDRTVMILMNTNGGSVFQYGSTGDGEAITLGADLASGDAFIDFLGPGNQRISLFGLAGQGWQIQSFLISSGNWSHRVNTEEVDSNSTMLITGNQGLVLGGDLTGTDLGETSIAAVVVYDTALTPEQFDRVVDYLKVKYGIDL